jgi:hypothetical protein
MKQLMRPHDAGDEGKKKVNATHIYETGAEPHPMEIK